MISSIVIEKHRQTGLSVKLRECVFVDEGKLCLCLARLDRSRRFLLALSHTVCVCVSGRRSGS